MELVFMVLSWCAVDDGEWTENIRQKQPIFFHLQIIGMEININNGY